VPLTDPFELVVSGHLPPESAGQPDGTHLFRQYLRSVYASFVMALLRCECGRYVGKATIEFDRVQRVPLPLLNEEERPGRISSLSRGSRTSTPQNVSS
jgi:hypothetical protein